MSVIPTPEEWTTRARAEVRSGNRLMMAVLCPDCYMPIRPVGAGDTPWRDSKLRWCGHRHEPPTDEEMEEAHGLAGIGWVDAGWENPRMD